jgi:hypothetical protein
MLLLLGQSYLSFKRAASFRATARFGYRFILDENPVHQARGHEAPCLAMPSDSCALAASGILCATEIWGMNAWVIARAPAMSRPGARVITRCKRARAPCFVATAGLARGGATARTIAVVRATSATGTPHCRAEGCVSGDRCGSDRSPQCQNHHCRTEQQAHKRH